MTSQRARQLCGVAAWALLAAGAIRANPPPTSQPASAPADPPTTASAPRDPTQPSARLSAVMARPAAAQGTARLPEITLKAFVHAVGQPPEAVLEVKGVGLFFVREGSRITVPLANGPNVALDVRQLGPDGVTIEAASLKELLTLR